MQVDRRTSIERRLLFLPYSQVEEETSTESDSDNLPCRRRLRKAIRRIAGRVGKFRFCPRGLDRCALTRLSPRVQQVARLTTACESFLCVLCGQESNTLTLWQNFSFLEMDHGWTQPRPTNLSLRVLVPSWQEMPVTCSALGR